MAPRAETGMQTFLRMANLFGPEPQEEERFGDMPRTLPVNPMNPMAPPLINRNVSTQTPRTYENMVEDEAIDPTQHAMSPVDEDAMLQEFRQNVLNPPKREHMTYPDKTLAGLEAALKIAAEPSPTSKNRVYVNGQAYQKQRVRYDPVTGEQQFITNVKDPSFMENVMRAMPAAVSGATDILNQPHKDAVTDWELQNKALKEGVTAEANMALAKYRDAQAGYTGQKAGLEQQKIDISRLTAQERARLSQLNTLTDAEKLRRLQDGRMSIAEFNAAEALKRVNVQQAGATQRTGMAQAGATTRTGMQQTGANQRSQAAIDAAAARQQVAGEQRISQIERRAELAQSKGLSPTQQRVEVQRNVAELITNNPELEDVITYDEKGFPVIEHDDPVIEAQIFDQIYGTPNRDINLPAPKVPTAVTPSGQRAPIGTPNMVMHPNAPRRENAISPGTGQVIKQYSPSRDQTRISNDGGKTWTVVQGRQ